MSSVIASPFHNTMAESVLSEIQSGSARYHYYIGKTLDFGVGEDVPIDSPDYLGVTRRSMINLLGITSSDVSFVIARVNWTSGTRYNKYESGAVGKQTNFYVMTDAFNVYKCLDNGVAGNLSTTKPTGTDIDPFMTADGYIWKFMYNIPLSLRNKFMTSVYIPVSTALQNRFFGSGEIDSITIEKHGAGYTQPTTSIIVTGDGTGAVLTPVITGGKLVNITITSAGTGYTFATLEVVSSLTIPDEDKASAVTNLTTAAINTQQAIVENLTKPGTIDSISVTNPGVGFTTLPTVVIDGDGTGAAATVTLFNGSITKVIMSNSGQDYTYANITLTNAAGATDYVLTANVSPALGHGRNAIKELYGDTLMFYGNAAASKVAGFTIENDYRQFGLIKNTKSATYDMTIPDQLKAGYFIMLTEDSISGFTIGDHIQNPGGDDYIIESKTTGSSVNAMEVSATGDWEPGVGVVFHKVGLPGTTFTTTGTMSSAFVPAKAATFCYVVTTTFNPALFPLDAILTANGDQFIVISHLGTTKIMLQSKDGGKLEAGDILSNGTDTFYCNTVTPPDADFKTGDIITIDNRAAFFQTAEQSVSFRTVIRF
jgi:hypothetical protein